MNHEITEWDEGVSILREDEANQCCHRYNKGGGKETKKKNKDIALLLLLIRFKID